MTEAIGDGSSVGAANVIGQRSGGRAVIAPERQYRGGGRPGRVSIKAPVELRDYRWVAKHSGDEPLTPQHAALQKVRRDCPEVFLVRLAELESEHAAVVERAKAAKNAPAVSPPAPAIPPTDHRDDHSRNGPDAVETPAKCEKLQPGAPSPERSAVGDPKKLAKIRERLERMKRRYKSGEYDGSRQFTWVGVVEEVEWMLREVNRMGSYSDSREFKEARSWVAALKDDYPEMVEQCVGTIMLNPVELLEKLDWLVSEVDWRLASGNAE